MNRTELDGLIEAVELGREGVFKLEVVLEKLSATTKAYLYQALRQEMSK